MAAGEKQREACLEWGEKIQGRFVVTKMIGQGGFGQIFLGTDQKMKFRKIAIKIEPHVTVYDANHDPRRLVLEKDVLVKLRGRQHIPVIYASGTTKNGCPFIVMQFLGPNLTHLRKQNPEDKFSQSTSFRIAQQIILALAVLHDEGYIHRDVKPHNVCSGPPLHTVYLVDFGMCRKWKEKSGIIRRSRGSAPFRGTIRYASYRMLSLQEAGPADDVIGWLYSIIELYNGSLPWKHITDTSQVCVMKAIIPVSNLCANMPPKFTDCYVYVTSLDATAMPAYKRIYDWLQDCIPAGVRSDDPFDWEE